MQNINEISWGGKKYYPSPAQVSNRMPKTPAPTPAAPAAPTAPPEEDLEFPGERYNPPFNYNEIVARASGRRDKNIIAHLRGMEYELTHAGARIISLVADSGLDEDTDMKYSFHVTFQGFTGYYSWADQWIGFDAEGQDVYGQGFNSLMQLQSDSEDWD